MAGAINIQQKLHSKITTAFTGKSSDFNTVSSLTAIGCQGYTKLSVQYIITKADSTWDRAGNIIVYGSWSESGTYTAPDNTIENASFAITTGEGGTTGGGEFYVVENIMPWIKVGWDNTTGGTKGTIAVKVMPFNE